MRTIGILLLALAAFTRLSAAAIPEGGGIMYGNGHSFTLDAPKGWVLDNTTMANQGGCAVFYPVGSNWKDSAVVFYVNTRGLTDKIHSPADVAADDIATTHKQGFNRVQAKKIEDIKLSHGRIASVWQYTGDQWGNYERSAFVQETGVINAIVMSARTEQDMKRALPAFRQLVSSYEYLGDVKIQN